MSTATQCRKHIANKNKNQSKVSKRLIQLLKL